ncbi:Glyoxylase, beta-lactamase superfamily II [Raineyella antarctica]|uniref:Glyoxylase, beta-lactamase superfamily II n=1 Tax=Raineyella antarctica TaxID=1577474 RepID=A0A1G6GE44_9ACTN|nr:MBL fold metallo-hydrolase [Raineyella antarctica]SDB80179.1 Glyoxylase, beta-lactamase superfamily II [Raineyella antarctica]
MSPVEKYHVEPGGPEVRVPVGELMLTKASVGPTDNNAYLIAGPSGPIVLVDCAADADRLSELAGDRTVGLIVTTHQHPDHIRVLAEMAGRTGASLVCGEPDRATIEERTGTRQRGVWDGDVVRCDGIGLGVIGLVGHTPGSITLVIQQEGGPAHLLTGDAIFPGGLGKTNSPEAFDSLYGDAVAKVFDRFPDSTVIHPGHGDSTTVGAERPHLEEWRRRGW